MQNVLSVDIGLTGAISLLNGKGELLICEPMPTYEIVVNKKVKNQYDINAIYQLIRRIDADYPITVLSMERLRPIPNQSSQTGFSLGMGQAIFRTLAVVLGIESLEVEPHSWQKEMFKGISYDKKTTKVASVQAAKRMFPNFNFKVTERCKKDSPDMTDSALIGAYTLLITKRK